MSNKTIIIILFLGAFTMATYLQFLGFTTVSVLAMIWADDYARKQGKFNLKSFSAIFGSILFTCVMMWIYFAYIHNK